MKKGAIKVLLLAALGSSAYAPATLAQTLSVTNQLALWVKADAGVTADGTGAVTGWADQSGNQNHAAQTDPTMTPLLAINAVNGKPAIRFDGANDYLDVTTSATLQNVGDLATYFVVRFDDFATYRAIWGKTAGPAGNLPSATDFYTLPNTGVPRAFRGNGLGQHGSVDGRAVRTGTYMVMGFEFSGTALTHYLNGQLTGTGTITAPLKDLQSNLKIGSRTDFVTKMKGDIAELLIYNKALSEADRTFVVGYLLNKYGIVNWEFNTNPGAAVTLSGQAKWVATGGVDNSGYISLTDAVPGQSGSLLLPNVNAANPIGGFIADFKLRIGGGTGSPADGFSFNFADDLPETFGEEGGGTGLTINFDTWDNGGDDTAPAIDVKVGGVIIASALMDGRRADSRPRGRAITKDQSGANMYLGTFGFDDVHVEVRDNLLTLVYKGVTVFRNLVLPSMPSTGRFGFGARTGALNDNHWLDSLIINTFVPSSAPVISAFYGNALGVGVRVTDRTISLDPASIRLVVDGAAVNFITNRIAKDTWIQFTTTPALLPSGSTHTVELSFADNGSPSGRKTNDFVFTVEEYGAPNGELDRSFSVGTGSNGPNGTINSIALDENGMIVVAGAFTTWSGRTVNRIARLFPSRRLDTNFLSGTGANGTIESITRVPWGFVVGGSFTTFNGISRSKVAALWSDGSLDETFLPGTISGDVLKVAYDSRVLIGGLFTTVAGASRNRIAALNAVGVLDSDYTPGTAAGDAVRAILPLGDGSSLIGGDFTTFAGQNRTRVARLAFDGRLDLTATFGTGANNRVYDFAKTASEQILVVGDFTTFRGISRNRIAQLNADGTLDTLFNPGTGANGSIRTVLVQPDGRILIGGDFTAYNGTSINRLARLNSNGSLDTSFNPGTGPNALVTDIIAQSDRQLLIAGTFGFYNEIEQNRLARLKNIVEPPKYTVPSIISAPNPVQEGQKLTVTLNLRNEGGLAAPITSARLWLSPLDDFTDAGDIEVPEVKIIPSLSPNGTNSLTWEVLMPNLGSGQYSFWPVAWVDANQIISSPSFLWKGESAQAFDAPVQQAPVFTRHPLSQTVTYGQVITFTVTVTGVPAPGLQWQRNGVNISGATNSNFSIPNVNDSHAGNYTVVASNGVGSPVTSNPAVLTVNPVTYTITASAGANGALSPNGSLTRNAGENVTFNATPAVGYDVDQWTVDGVVVQAGQRVFTVTNLQKNLALGVTFKLAPITEGSVVATLDPGTLFSAPNTVAAHGIAAQSDGRFLVMGNQDIVNRRLFYRYNRDGSLDTNFVVNAPSDLQYGGGLWVQPDDKILYAYQPIGSKFIIRRANADGTPDATFTQVVLDGDNNFLTLDIAIQADRKSVLVGGFSAVNGSTGGGGIVRLNENGSVDTGFSVGTAIGGAGDTTPNPARARFAKVVIQPDQKILVGGPDIRVFNTNPVNSLVRLNPNGSVDTTFRAFGAANANPPKVVALGLQPNGMILAATTGELTPPGALARLRSDGSVDTSFADIRLKDPRYVGFTIIPVLGDKILIGGSFGVDLYFGAQTAENQTPSRHLLRLNGNGSLDRSFAIGEGVIGSGINMAVLPNGNIVIGGDFTRVNGVPRTNLAMLVNTNPPTANLAVIVTHPSDQTVTVGGAVSFTVVASGIPVLTYQWQKNGAIVPGATNATLTLSNVTAADAGSYAAAVSNGLGAPAVSNPATLTVNPAPQAPVITTQPQNQSITNGGSVTFTVTATGVPTPVFQWRKNGVNLEGKTSASLTLTNITSVDAGGYSVIVSNSVSSVTSAEAILTVIPDNLPPAVQITLPVNNAVFTNPPVTVSIQATASDADGQVAKVEFYEGANKLGEATASPYAFAWASVAGGSYTLTAKATDNKGASTTSAPVTIVVQTNATLQGLEADLSPRPNGDNRLSPADFTVAARLVGGLNVISNASEFARVDCAPRSTSGDGRMTAADWTQAGRYVAGLDVAKPAGGPLGPLNFVGVLDRQSLRASAIRVVRVVDGTGKPGDVVPINVEMAAQGNENTVGFSLNFDSALLQFSSFSNGTGLPGGASVIVNTNQVSAGKVGVLIGLPAGQIFSAGTKQLANVSFQIKSGAQGQATLTFGDQPIFREIVSADADVLEAAFSQGKISIESPGAPPTITQQPQSMSVNAGANVTLSVAAAGTAPLAYQWKFNGNILANATNSTLTLNNVTTTQAGSYTVDIRNATGSTTSVAAVLEVKVAPPATRIVQAGQASGNVGAIVGLPITLVAAGNENTVGFSLNFDATALEFASSTNGANLPAGTQLIINTNQLSSAKLGVLIGLAAGQGLSQGTQQVVVVNFKIKNAGSTPITFGDQPIFREVVSVDADVLEASFAQGQITGQSTLTPPTVTQQPQSVTVNAGANVTLSVTAAGTAPLAYQWKFNGNILANATNATLMLNNITLAQKGSYTVDVSNSAGSTTSAPALVDVTIVVPTTRLVKAGDASGNVGSIVGLPITLVAAGNENTVGFSLNFDATALEFASTTNGANLPAGTQLIVNTNQLASAKLGVLIGLAAGQGLSQGTQQVIVVNFKIKNAGSTLITFGDQPIFREVVSVDAEVLEASFAQGQITGQSTATPPTITQQPQSMTVNAGANVTLSVVAAGTVPLAYQWRFNGVELAGQTNASLALNSVTASQQGAYTVRITNIGGFVDSAAAHLTVDAIVTAPVISSQPQSQFVLAGGQATFAVVAQGGGNLAYQWFFNDQPLAGATGSQLIITNAQAGNQGRYTVEISNAGGKIKSIEVTLALLAAPTVRLNLAPALTVVGQVGLSYRIEYANAVTAPTVWNNLVTVMLTNSSQIYVDVEGLGKEKRFYRAVLQP